MLGPYRAILRIPTYRLPLLLGLLSSLPLGMVGLALLLTAQERSGSLAHAGLVPAAFGLGNAAGLFLQGRLIDRLGQTRVLVPASLVCALTLGIAVLPAWRGSIVFPALAFVAGVAFPATISSMRVLTADLIHDPRLRISGYALLAVSFGMALVLGPLLVSALVAVADPVSAVVLAALVIAAGGLGFAATPASRRWRPSQRYGARRIGLRPGLVTLFAGNAALGFAGGVTAVALPAAALDQGAAALAGIGFATKAIGDLVGGLAYGAIRWRAGRTGQLVASLVVAALVGWAIAAASGSLALLFGILLVAGALAAGVGICWSALLDDVAPEGGLTTAYAWMVGLGLVASAAGTAVAGTVAEKAGPGWAFATSATAITVAALWVAVRRRTLTPSMAERWS